MIKIKRIFYNWCIDNILYYILCLVLVVCSFYCFNEKMYIVLALILCNVFVCGLLLYFVLRDKAINRNRNYLSCTYSIVRLKYVWINQKIAKNRDMNKCQQKEFVREMKDILKSLPKGTLCYCCTHELIVEHIKKNCQLEKCDELYEKDLKKLKEKLEAGKCKSCNNKSCTLKKSEVTQFYAIKFTI